MNDRNLEIVAGMYDAFTQGDIAAVLQRLDANVEWHSAEHDPYDPGGPFVGPDAVLEGVFMRLAADWDDFGVTPFVFHSCGEVVIVEGRLTGRHRATGRELDAEFCHVFTLAGGPVVSVRAYEDTAQLRAVAGFSAAVV
jgi:ketosteroid isomerase-like protein